jgi:hypothetical protein
LKGWPQSKYPATGRPEKEVGLVKQVKHKMLSKKEKIAR